MRRCEIPAAVARIHGDSANPRLHGTVKFYPWRDGTLVTADVWGLPDSETGFFALHIHETGDCGGDGFPGTGSHYNPRMQPHPRHAGDLPPLLGDNGRAHLTVFTSRFRVPEILGRSVVIHSGPDDFRTQPAGNPGIKIACGVISGQQYRPRSQAGIDQPENGYNNGVSEGGCRFRWETDGRGTMDS